LVLPVRTDEGSVTAGLPRLSVVSSSFLISSHCSCFPDTLFAGISGFGQRESSDKFLSTQRESQVAVSQGLFRALFSQEIEGVGVPHNDRSTTVLTCHMDGIPAVHQGETGELAGGDRLVCLLGRQVCAVDVTASIADRGNHCIQFNR
jgi:hypothetical protein